MPLNLESLALLELIENRGSFAAAATALNKAPSAITYQLRQLEESLDLLIYDRSGHRAKLTAAGQILLNEGRRLLEESESLKKKVKAIASGWEPELRIVLDALVPFGCLTHTISLFDAIQAPTRLRFSSEVLSGTWEKLHSGRAELLIGPRLEQNQFASSTGLNIRTIGQAEFVFAVSPAHPLAQTKEPIGQEEISRHHAVAVGDTSRQFKPLTLGIQAGQAVLTVPDLHAKVQAQIDGLGCGWLPAHLAKPWIQSGHLITKKVQESDRKSELCIAWAKGHQGQALTWWTEELTHSGIQLATL